MRDNLFYQFEAKTTTYMQKKHERIFSFEAGCEMEFQKPLNTDIDPVLNLSPECKTQIFNLSNFSGTSLDPDFYEGKHTPKFGSPFESGRQSRAESHRCPNSALRPSQGNTLQAFADPKKEQSSKVVATRVLQRHCKLHP